MDRETYMHRCLELAQKGFVSVRPNPMVGCVLVKDGHVIGEGYHQRYGEAHAEVAAINSVGDQNIVNGCDLFVNLEPCSHFGKTPPCVDLLIEKGVKRVFIGESDPHPLVSGNGIRKLREHGIEVEVGILAEECRRLNKRFYVFHERERPYIILKWAQTKDGFIARSDYSSKWISSEASRALVHTWRSEEMAVMVGTNTALQDNPHLTARIEGGQNPVRVVLDRTQKIPTSFHIFDESAKTLLFNEAENYSYPAADLVKIDFSHDVIPQVINYLYRENIQSLIVEGGTTLLMGFIEGDLWDEVRVFVSNEYFGEGIKAPLIDLKVGVKVPNGDGDLLHTLTR